MPEKFNIVFDAKTLEEFGRLIKEFAAQYVNSLNKPAQGKERLLFEDVPGIEIKPKSIGENQEKEEEKRPKNIGTFSNPAKNKKLKMVEDGGEL